jgi:hypothetical protein
MSSTSVSDAEFITLLNNVSAQISRYFSMSIFLFGTIGNILNILIFCQKSLRKIPCAFLFLVSSIASLVSIDFGLVTRMLSGWAVDPTYTIGWLCKLRTFIVFSSRAMVFWLFVLATVDRWLSSSVDAHRRQMSTMKNARRGTILVVITSWIVYAELFYCYDANLVNAPFICYAKTQACQILADMTFVCFTTIVPVIFMFIFGLLTIVNIRQSRHRIAQMTGVSMIQPTTINQTSTNSNEADQRSKKTEHHLLMMVFVQVIVLAVLTLPQAIQRLYAAFIGPYDSQVKATVDMFVYNFVLLLTYMASAMPFYIFTLTGGTLFQKAFRDLFKSCQFR